MSILLLIRIGLPEILSMKKWVLPNVKPMFTDYVSTMKKTDIIVLLDIDNTLFNTEKLKNTNLSHFELYDEVKDTLSELAKIATLGIISQGDIAFQTKKFE